ELVKPHERLVGALGLTEGLKQRWRQFSQALARFGRLGGLVAAEMPAADDPANIAHTLEAKAVQRFERVRIVHVTREDEISEVTRQLRCGFKQRRIVLFDGAQRRAELVGESLLVREIQKQRDAAQSLM